MYRRRWYVTTNNKDWAEKVQMYGLHGMCKGARHRYSDKSFKHYQVVFPGYKYNMMDIQAALGIHQLKLHNENIGTGIHFVALHLHPYYANTFGFKRGDFPNAEFVSERTISLPLSAKLTEEDTDDVINAVKKIVEKHYI